MCLCQKKRISQEIHKQGRRNNKILSIFKFIFAQNDIITVYSIFLQCRRRECEEISGTEMDNERQCIDQIKISGVDKENTSLSK